eukprot:TRINITY_DN23898_c0_g1_i2.p1 TRINITY_DN23898_c0_g1~~TRINITY_DN23898_c0_g1_i2.p1  ORF type:complete len:940 (-),score=247.69 TRINITY_DN23898_c0_g1_i2:62-2881(-)
MESGRSSYGEEAHASGMMSRLFGSVNPPDSPDAESGRGGREAEPLLGSEMDLSLLAAADHEKEHSFLGDGQIDVEDFGFSELEVRPSAKREGVSQQINQLKENVLRYQVPKYLDQFDEEQEKESLLVGSVSLEEIELQEQEIERRHIEDATRLAEAHGKRQQELTHLEMDARDRVDRLWQQHAAAAHAREMSRLDLHRQRTQVLDSAFKQAEEQLKVALERRKAQIKMYYGDLVESEDLADKLKGRYFELDWEMAPQPLELEIHSLRGLRDKLPRGFYVLRVSLFDQLAGSPMVWTELGNLGDERWFTALAPQKHSGRYDAISMDFDTSIFTVAPAPKAMKPSYCIMFQLFLLRGDKRPKTREVGWGAFPLSSPTFDTVEGKFKCPMLRGQMDPKMDRYQEIEEMVKYDIDNWLGNMYFRVNHLERYIDGHREFNIQLDFARFVLSGAPPDPEGNDWKRQLDVTDDEIQAAALEGNTDQVGELRPAGRERSTARRLTHSSEHPFVGQRPLEGDEMGSARVIGYTKDGVPEYAQPASSSPQDKRARWSIPGCSDVTFCFGSSLEQQKAMQDAMIAAQEAKERAEHHAQAGHRESWLTQRDFYQYHLNQPVGTLERRKASNQFDYVRRSLLKDLGFEKPKSLECIASVVLTVVLFFVRMYVHYLGQWFFLKIENVVVNSFTIEAFRMKLDYDATSIQVRVELGVVLMGPCMNIALFLLSAGLAAFCNWWLDDFPDFGCRAIALYGFMVMLDPFLIAVVDSLYLPDSYPSGDIFKLYKKFLDEEDSGITGIVMTSISYCLLAAFAALFLYYYLLLVHMMGHINDVYARLHGDKFAFFIPDDSEVSWREVQYVCRRAKEYRGPQGQLHRVQVVDYVHRDRHDTDWEDCTTAITVFEPVSYTHLRAHETPEHLVCRLLLEKKKKKLEKEYRQSTTKAIKIEYKN